MATKGLGKGLGALISLYDEENEEVLPTQKAVARVLGDSTPSSKVVDENSVQEIEISQIDNNINQPRKIFDQEKLQELAQSIKKNGVIQPIILKRVGTRYIIIAGERRWRASSIAGLKTIPAIVREFTASQADEIAIIENLQRQDLGDIELARGIQKLLKTYDLTQEQVSQSLGKTRSHISHLLRLLTLPKEIIELVENGELSGGHARCLVTVQDKDRAISLAHKCIKDDLSVRDLEKILHSTSQKSSNTSTKPTKSIELREFERKMTQILSTKVTITGNTTKGRITIDYFTSADLLRLKKKIVDINELYSVEDKLSNRPKM